MKATGRFMLNAARLPIYAALVLLEPLVRVLLCGLACLALTVAIVFRASAVPHFHFGLMIVVSVACALFVLAYEALIVVIAAAAGR